MEGFLQHETPLVTLLDSAVEQILLQTSIGGAKDRRKTFAAADQLLTFRGREKRSERSIAENALHSFFFFG